MENLWKLLLFLGLFSPVVAFSKDYVGEVRQNFKEKSNSELNNQMAAFQRASLVYMAYASYFDRSNVNLPGFRKFFLAASQASLRDSQKVIDYINLRGGHQQFPLLDMNAACRSMKVPKDLQNQFPDHKPQICHFILKKDSSASLKKKKKHSYSLASLFAAKKPAEAELSNEQDWQHGLMALSDALLLERALNRQLIDLAQGASKRNDKHLRHTVEDVFLTQQTKRIKKLADVITKLRQYSEQDYPLGEYVIDLEMSN